MLVLSRKKGQSVELPEMDVVVRVISVKGSRVQLGIEAPREITVSRSERPLNASPPSVDANRIGEELARLENDLAALAELADAKDASIAGGIAAESIQRLEGIKRSLKIGQRQQRSEARPISELVQVRAEVLSQLRKDQKTEQTQPVLLLDAKGNSARCVRQPTSDYAVRPTGLTPACSVA